MRTIYMPNQSQLSTQPHMKDALISSLVLRLTHSDLNTLLKKKSVRLTSIFHPTFVEFPVHYIMVMFK